MPWLCKSVSIGRSYSGLRSCIFQSQSRHLQALLQGSLRPSNILSKPASTIAVDRIYSASSMWYSTKPCISGIFRGWQYLGVCGRCSFPQKLLHCILALSVIILLESLRKVIQS